MNLEHNMIFACNGGLTVLVSRNGNIMLIACMCLEAGKTYSTSKISYTLLENNFSPKKNKYLLRLRLNLSLGMRNKNVSVCELWIPYYRRTL